MSLIASSIRSENIHFKRNPYKIGALILFFVAAIYGLQNGYTLYQTQTEEIEKIKLKNKKTSDQVVQWFAEGKSGPENRPWINISEPYWSLWYTPSPVCKTPSGLMPLSIGQSEQFGYYKQVTNRSTPYDADLAEEIANPERLAIGTLDFSFVILFLLPAILLVLLFNIGGLEKDLGFEQLIFLSVSDHKIWILGRYLYYLLIIVATILLTVLPYSILTKSMLEHPGKMLLFFLYTFLYVVSWMAIFFIVSVAFSGSKNISIVMVALWLTLTVVLPGTSHQLTTLNYPATYMTDLLDAKREEADKISELPKEKIKNLLIASFPELRNSLHYSDTSINEEIINNSVSYLVNNMMQETARKIDVLHEEKNSFIKKLYLINPVGFFQNKLNGIADTDYYSFQLFRNKIQDRINKKVSLMASESWNKVSVDSVRYQQYLKELND